MFKQILVPLDGSALAERAIPYAAQVATAAGASVHLVRVIEPSSAANPPATQTLLPTGTEAALRATEQAEASRYLDTQRARPELAGLPIQSQVLAAQQLGSVAALLLEHERDVNIDLVVATTHGRGGMARFALGSVAARLVRYGAAALLLVRAFGDPPSLSQVVVPLDGSAAAEWALRVPDELAGAVVREVTLLEAIADAAERRQAEGYLATVASRLQQAGLTYYQRVKTGDPPQVILGAAGLQTPVVMATRGRSGLTRWSLGTVANRVVHSGEVSVWLVRAD